MSGRKTDKPSGRAAAVSAIKAGTADVLIRKDLDRATRDAYDGLALQRKAKAEGCRIVTTKGEARAARVSCRAHGKTRASHDLGVRARLE
jgi:Resolvase, N terminal domain